MEIVKIKDLDEIYQEIKCNIKNKKKVYDFEKYKYEYLQLCCDMLNNYTYNIFIIHEPKKGKYRLYGDDYKISKIFNLKKYKVNKLILDNLDIKNIVRYKDNRYKELYSKMLLLDIIINKIKRQSYESLI